MSLREFQKQYTAAIIGVAVGLLLCSVGFIVWGMMPRGSANGDEYVRLAYYYDLNAKKLIEVPSTTVPPMQTDSGDYQGMAAGVKAHVFCCGPRMRDTQLFIGYLEVPVTELPEALRPSGMDLTDEEGEPLLAIRSEENETWLDPDSAAGKSLMENLSNRCGKEMKLTYINPIPRKK